MFKKKFHGGIQLEPHTSDIIGLPIITVPPPSRLFVPLLQHVGNQAHSVVTVGDQLRKGQPIALCTHGLGAPVHSPCSGVVKSIAPGLHPSGLPVECVEIENDGFDTWYDRFGLSRPYREAAPGEIVNLISSSGIVGLSGEGYPTHAKLTFSGGRKADTLIINVVECEPFCVADQRLVIENTEAVLTGIQIARKIVGAKSVIIAVSKLATQTIDALTPFLSDDRFKDCTLAKLNPRYPLGHERQLIVTLLKREIPLGGAPIDLGCVVFNVATVFAMYEAVIDGTPLIERIITVAGDGVGKPGAYRVRIGTPLVDVLTYAHFDGRTLQKVISGGFFNGLALADLRTPVIKTTTAIMTKEKDDSLKEKTTCIDCGYCAQVCPAKLMPSAIAMQVQRGRYDLITRYHVLECIECGCCSYICPSRIDLVHCMQLGKHHVELLKVAVE